MRRDPMIKGMGARTIGELQGHFALAPLVASAEATADTTRTSMLEHLCWFRHQFQEWLYLIEDLREGSLDARQASIASAAFRPNFHAARGADHLVAEQWTESTLRYVLAGETLVRDVIMSALHEKLDATLTTAQLITHWRKTAPELSRLARWDLEAEPAWQSFNALYADRNTRFGHGQEEANVEDALRARSVWADLRDLMQTLFAHSHGISLALIQARVLHERAEQLAPHERAASAEAVDRANAAIRDGRKALLKAIKAHQPKQPQDLADAYAALSSADQELADSASSDAIAEDFAKVQAAWQRVTDFDSVLEEAVFGPCPPLD